MNLPFKLKVSAAIAVISATSAFASHHFESEIPELDSGDLYVFDAPSGESTVFVFNFNPGLTPEDTNPFVENAHYNIHVAYETEKFEEGLTFSIAYDDETGLHLYKMEGANEKVGRIGEEIASGAPGGTIEGEDGIRMWTGVITELFPGNSVGFRRFLGKIAEGEYNTEVFAPAEDIFGQYNVGSIVLEVPNAMLNEDIAVYATTEIEEDGQWRQIQRQANILTTHMFFGDQNPEAAEHNHHRPEVDVSQRYSVSANILRTVVLGGTQEDPVAYADETAAALLPDVLRYKVGTEAEYTIENRNGRPLDDDAMNVALSMFAGEPLDDLVDPVPEKRTEEFPYVVRASDYAALIAE